MALLKKYATGVGLWQLEDWSPSQLHFCLLLEAQDVSSGLVVLGTEHAFHTRRCSLYTTGRTYLMTKCIACFFDASRAQAHKASPHKTLFLYIIFSLL